MDQHSTVDRGPESTEAERHVVGSVAHRSTHASVSAGIAAANAHLPQLSEPGPRFPGEDGGRSLAEMARRDLDSALQLLAERAQYITAASGAAIALRRGEHNDMLCRASAGSNAPELGALLSMEYGLSGESVRTRQTLRCDDVENDPRVNREGCRQLGIASVVVMPVVSEQQVLGVFELFSKQPRAFESRDISALQRLSRMVETAVKHAVAAQAVPAVEEEAVVQAPPVEQIKPVTIPVEAPVNVELNSDAELPAADSIPKDPVPQDLAPAVPDKPERDEAKLEKTQQSTPEPPQKKPLYWSIATQAQASARVDETAASIAVPAVLKGLQKCQACGFPVSQGRTFCVECEEKQWRGQRVSPPSSEPENAELSVSSVGAAATLIVAAAAVPVQESVTTATATSHDTNRPTDLPAKFAPSAPAEMLSSDSPTLFLSSAATSESWLSANKYVLGTLVIVAIVIAVIVWLR